MKPKQRKAIERTIRDTHEIHGKGKVVAIVWGMPMDGFENHRQGVVVNQIQHGMGYIMGYAHFTVAQDLKTIRYLNQNRFVLS